MKRQSRPFTAAITTTLGTLALLSGCFSASSKPEAGSLLHAVAANNEQLAQVLLREGADVNESAIAGGSGERITPLMIAVVNRNQRLVDLLLLNGATTHQTVLGYSAQDLALHIDDENVLKSFEIRAGGAR